ncbi:cytochrome P450 [Roridomyces roridus]|uniref:Cytochrome P450 n=1 Tax=Roridomyces roridus TaxID=1738132 RepID=A0AAD7FSA1_9AGAR|nr:cytochrome P450 [Roridomyces roridus]
MSLLNIPLGMQLAALIFLGFLFRRILVLRKASQDFNGNNGNLFPTLYTAFQPWAMPGVFFPTTRWTTSFDWQWIRRRQLYTDGVETVNLVPVLSGIPGLWTSNMDIGRQILAGGQRSNFKKTEASGRPFSAWGMNLAASNGPTWQKHRRIIGPAFGVDLYKLVWTQTARLYREMLEVEGWQDSKVVDIPVIQRLTLKLAFLIISSCGFGIPCFWADPPKSADGSMTMQETLKLVTDSHMLPHLIPSWLMPFLPISKVRVYHHAKERIAEFMQQQVMERKAEVASGSEMRADAFTILVKANQAESGKYQLDDQELVGNVFLFMFAGHETTSHTIAGTLSFLAIHEEIQNEVVEQIMSVVGLKRDPEYDDYSKLDKVLAVFYEAGRMFPAGYGLAREAVEDTVLTIPNPVGEEGSKTIPIPKGTEVMLDMIGVQYNPRYFEDPQMYKPSRWYGLPRTQKSSQRSVLAPGIA